MIYAVLRCGCGDCSLPACGTPDRQRVRERETERDRERDQAWWLTAHCEAKTSRLVVNIKQTDTERHVFMQPCRVQSLGGISWVDG